MCNLAYWLERRCPLQQARVHDQPGVFLLFFVLPYFSGKWTAKFRQLLELYFTGILQSIYRKNGAGKKRPYTFCTAIPTDYLPELSGKLKTVWSVIHTGTNCIGAAFCQSRTTVKHSNNRPYGFSANSVQEQLYSYSICDQRQRTYCRFDSFCFSIQQLLIQVQYVNQSQTDYIFFLAKQSVVF